MMSWLQIKDAWRDIEFTNQGSEYTENKLITVRLKATPDGGAISISHCQKKSRDKSGLFISADLSKDDLIALGRFLKPFVDEAERV
jgi:hypothetical protein